MQVITFKFDCELDTDDFIPEGTRVEVYRKLPENNYTSIIYNNEVIDFMDVAFVEQGSIKPVNTFN